MGTQNGPEEAEGSRVMGPAPSGGGEGCQQHLEIPSTPPNSEATWGRPGSGSHPVPQPTPVPTYAHWGPAHLDLEASATTGQGALTEAVGLPGPQTREPHPDHPAQVNRAPGKCQAPCRVPGGMAASDLMATGLALRGPRADDALLLPPAPASLAAPASGKPPLPAAPAIRGQRQDQPLPVSRCPSHAQGLKPSLPRLPGLGTGLPRLRPHPPTLPTVTSCCPPPHPGPRAQSSLCPKHHSSIQHIP